MLVLCILGDPGDLLGEPGVFPGYRVVFEFGIAEIGSSVGGVGESLGIEGDFAKWIFFFDLFVVERRIGVASGHLFLLVRIAVASRRNQHSRRDAGTVPSQAPSRIGRVGLAGRQGRVALSAASSVRAQLRAHRTARSRPMQPPASPRMPHPQVEARRNRILESLGRDVRPISAGRTLSPERLRYLVNEAEELYWNELAWEELTEEERVSGGPLTELVFPGLLAFIDALLISSDQSESGSGIAVGSGPHTDVVEEILLFLAERHDRVAEDLGRGADSGNLVWARAMTAHLIDLVLYRLYDLSRDEREELEARSG